ncbi:MAG: LPS export ABC transporter periplasmic protein LptC [Deltaproteobacteria bacterium]|nr:LPS export ABC transporter periplasmic protein LptC [Deltaproteobacteria bacterium]
MSKIRIVLFCVICVMLFGLGIGMFRFHHLKKEPEAALSLLPEDSDIGLNRVHHTATRYGVREWVLDAESARYQKQENKTILKRVSVTFFLKDGKTVHLTGSEGVLLTDTKDMEISGDVVVRSSSNELKTERLYYDHKSRSISTDTPVVVSGEGIYLTGASMAFSFDTEQAMVSGGVKTVVESYGL